MRKLAAYAISLLCLSAHFNAAVADDFSTVELYDYMGTYLLSAPPPNMEPIILHLPEKFSGANKGKTIRNWGLNIITYYPSFGSPSDPENEKYSLKCIGICNGRIMVGVENKKTRY